MDIVRDLILSRLKQTHQTMSGVSRQMGLNASYLQQFLKRGVPEELGEDERNKLAQILSLDPDQLRGKSPPLPPRTYGRPNHNHTAASTARNGSQDMSGSRQNFIESVRPLSIMSNRDLPVFGTAEGGDGALLVTDRPVDWEARPDFLARTEDAYGMIITGDSMDPECKHGSTALVNPHLPPRNGDTCIFRAHADDGAVHCMVKQLVRYNDKTWYVHQHNPKKDFELKRAEWQVCHTVVGNYSRR
jgi:phage repressor protein C with HTH and peptisase S24 domain